MTPCVVRTGARLLAALTLPTVAGAQLVTPKTVPVRQGEQFEIFPSARAGMAGLRIALDDTLADPFVNPAKAIRVRQGAIFSTPFFHSLSRGGGGRTIPIGGMGARGDWAAAGIVAFQQLDRAGPTWNLPTSERTAVNRYAAGSLARRLGSGVTLGVSAFGAELGAVDGVDQLYAGSDRIAQTGSLVDLRLGVTKQWNVPNGRRVAELLIVHNRTDMTHDVHFTNWTWNPLTFVSTSSERSEHNVDRTHVWGLHSQYVQPLGGEGWRLGLLATGNRLSHPKIPNYVIMNIPRDPGTTYAANLGVGVARLVGRTTFGIDAVYEPMRSTTWAAAERDTSVIFGRVVPAGARTIDNRFRFGNTRLRVGVARDAAARETGSSFGYQLGIGVTDVDYTLRQRDNLRATDRRQRERWTEWTPTFGFQWRRRELDVRYSLRMTCQGGSDCFPFIPMGDDVTVVNAPTTGGVIVAPAAPLTFDGGRVATHQLTIVVPIR